MTSKEIILSEIKRWEHNLKIYEKEKMETQIEYAKTNIVFYNYILKDLEILEIIKKWFMKSITDYREYDNTLFVDTFIRDDEPIFKILGKWLDEN